jgi:hypothetical protein
MVKAKASSIKLLVWCPSFEFGAKLCYFFFWPAMVVRESTNTE